MSETETIEKRGRGRPRKEPATPADAATLDPETLVTEPGDAADSEPAKRGRKPGSRNAGKPVSLDSVTELLAGIHATLAIATRTPELALEADEASALGKAIVDFQKHYTGVVSAKTLDTMRLCMVVATVYGSRVMRIHARRGTRKTPAKPATVPVETVSVYAPTESAPPAKAPHSPRVAPAGAPPNGEPTWHDAFLQMTAGLEEEGPVH